MKTFEKYFDFENKDISGLTRELAIIYIASFFKEKKQNVLVVCDSLIEATNFHNDLSTYAEVIFFPEEDNLLMSNKTQSPEMKFMRLEAINKIKNGNNIVVTNKSGFLKKLPQKESSESLILKKDLTINRNLLIEKLESLGYKREVYTTRTGEYSIRGLVLDIFPVYENNPIRVLFNEDKVEEIKYFNEITQLTFEVLKTITINSVIEGKENLTETIKGYLGDPALFFIDINDIDKKNKDNYRVSFSKKRENVYNSAELNFYNENYAELKRDLEKKYKDKDIFFYLTKEKIIEQIKTKFPTRKIVNKKINKGFEFGDQVVITDSDIISEKTKEINYRKKYKFGLKVKKTDEITKGDYVVHTYHGIGIYNGLVKLKQKGVFRDYIQIKYAKGESVYISVESINNLYKYGDKEGRAPTINSLNSESWFKTLRTVKDKIDNLTEELIELYEKRIETTTKPYKEYLEEEVFKSAFQYRETEDQTKSIKEILNDLKKPFPMVRLLCGDVGFGKTEVANRAMFSAVLNNKQVMYLCPTTILSMQQHEKTIDRFKDWPITIELLNRFTPQSRQKEIINDLKERKIDIVFGTHRLLSVDVKFKDLDLLIIDEEQRFGVKDKEKITKIKENINVLSMSATPIPRTLEMSISGLRDLSLIETPPTNRLPVQTYVLEEDFSLIKDVIEKEKQRKGQTYILYNKVKSIALEAEKIQSLTKGITVSYIHGQMNKNEIEKTLRLFQLSNIDVLVSTTIIENGIDIENVNSLIILDADKFGLSQLYQIRGRIGRGDKIAFAYLMYKGGKKLTPEATKRLKAIEEFTELGSGYDIALRDLSIRGAGDIFGKNQSGFVDKVGMDYYLSLVRASMDRKKNIEENNTGIKKTSLTMTNHIRDDYLQDEEIKISMHKQISKINNLEEYKTNLIEIEDRFGEVPTYLREYMLKVILEKKLNEFDYHLDEDENIVINDNLEIDDTRSTAFFIKNRRNQTIIYKEKNKSNYLYLMSLVKALDDYNSK